MSTKRIVFVGLLFVLMLFIVGCSPAEVSEEQIKNDVTSSAPEWDTDAVIDSFTIVRRTPDEEEKTEKVHVKIDGKTDLLYSLRYYTLSYFYSKDEGWMLSDIEAEDEDLWITEPLAGPDPSLARQALMDKYIYVNGDQWDITEETIKDILINKNDISLDDHDADILYTVILENDLVTATGSAVIEYSFDPEYVTDTEKEDITKDGWYVADIGFGDDYVCQYKEDSFHPEPDRDEILDYFDNSRIHFNNNSYNDSQYIYLKRENIRNLVVGPVIPLEKGSLCVYEGRFEYQTAIATFDVNYQLSFESEISEDLDEGTTTMRWYWGDTEIDSQCISINLPKHWSGTYNDGKMGVDLTLTNIKSTGDLEAIYSFYPMPGNTDGKSGSYKMKGSYNPKTLEIALNGSEWIDRPSWYSYVNINGIIKINNNSIVSNSNEFCVFTETIAQRMKKTPTICDELGYLTDTQIQELKTASDTIYSKYGVGIVLVLTSTEEDIWDYLIDYQSRISSQHQYKELGLFSIDVGGDLTEFKDGYVEGRVGDKLNKLILSEMFYTYAKQGDIHGMIKEYFYSVNRFIGGKDSDLTFSW